MQVFFPLSLSFLSPSQAFPLRVCLPFRFELFPASAFYLTRPKFSFLPSLVRASFYDPIFLSAPVPGHVLIQSTWQVSLLPLQRVSLFAPNLCAKLLVPSLPNVPSLTAQSTSDFRATGVCRALPALAASYPAITAFRAFV